MMAVLKSKACSDSGLPRRLVIVVRADPVICGHSGEARNLAEVALQRGFTDVRIVTWPLDLLATSGLLTAKASRWNVRNQSAITRCSTAAIWRE
jgi:hypothetical protein